MKFVYVVTTVFVTSITMVSSFRFIPIVLSPSNQDAFVLKSKLESDKGTNIIKSIQNQYQYEYKVSNSTEGISTGISTDISDSQDPYGNCVADLFKSSMEEV